MLYQSSFFWQTNYVKLPRFFILTKYPIDWTEARGLRCFSVGTNLLKPTITVWHNCKGSRGQHGAHLGPVVPRWAPCRPHEPCYLGSQPMSKMYHKHLCRDPKLYTVYPKKYAHGFCFAVLCCGYTLTDFPISIRLTSLALWQSNDCPSASKATLMNMDKYFMWIHYERLHNHNKAKHNNFLGYTVSPGMRISTYLLF